MSAALYIVLEKEITGSDHDVRGKALSRANTLLDALAKEAGVKPLMQFFSASRDELAGFLRDHGVDVDEEAEQLELQKWFLAEDGLKTVLALRRVLQEKGSPQNDRVLADLEESRQVHEVANKNGVRWHLAVDYQGAFHSARKCRVDRPRPGCRIHPPPVTPASACVPRGIWADCARQRNELSTTE